MFVEDEKLTLSIVNTGKGFKAEDIPLIFDRYSILENFEKHSKNKLVTSNGLGLSICHSMVKLLSGKIEVYSTPNEYTEFKVTLPLLEADSEKEIENNIIEFDNLFLPQMLPETLVSIGDYEFHHSQQTILVIDDDPEILWLIAEIFTEHYNIIPIQNSEAVLDALNQFQPNLIISDIMMPGMDGITLTRRVKSDKKTSHIPLILLSAKNSSEEQIEGINAGAEFYITKPFNVDYLKSIVERMMHRQDDLREYYSSALSSFEVNEGKLVHKEDKALFKKVMEVIDMNIANPQFNVEKLATELGMSSRHLYRKLKLVSEFSAVDLIKEYRMKVAENLLVSTNYTVDEIINKIGFTHRASFYRIFSQKHGITPKEYRKQKKESV